MEERFDNGQQSWGPDLRDAFFCIAGVATEHLVYAGACLLVGATALSPLWLAGMYSEKSLPQPTSSARATEEFGQLNGPKAEVQK